MKPQINKELHFERNKLLKKIIKTNEIPLMILSVIWIIILIVDLLNKTNAILNFITISIWIIFILDFLLKLWIAPKKITFLKRNILTIISLIIPALRILRIYRIIRLIRLMRGVRLIKVLGGINRSMNSLGSVLHRRKAGYVILLTSIVILVGGAGMFTFEKDVNEKFNTYGDSLWVSAMIVSSIGTDWPVTSEGRILCFILALYGLAVFGYITASIASFFIGRDAENSSAEIAGSKEIQDLKNEILLLKEELKKTKD